MAEASCRGRGWVFPNSRAIGLAAVLLAMWYAGASQSNGAAYLICFVLSSLAIVAWAHTWANLRGVGVAVGKIAPIFAGDRVIIPLLLDSSRRCAHCALQVSIRDMVRPALFAEVNAENPATGELQFISRQRGSYRHLELRVASSYPLGFFTARQRIVVPQDYFIYPKPEGSVPIPRSPTTTRQPRTGRKMEGDDFGGLRAWRPGESQRRIDWKSAARGHALLTKEWTGEADEVLSLDWALLGGLAAEARLSQLARWVLLAERGSSTYGLRIPGKTISPGRGERHFHQCLRALAAFDSAFDSRRPENLAA